MRTYNRATLIGHVGNDVELRRTATGKSVVNLSLATTQRHKDKEASTTWHRIVLWDKHAELAERFVRKGHCLYVEGPLNERKWTDSAGVTRFKTELVARELIFLTKAATGHEDAPGARFSAPGQRAPDGEELSEVRGEIPF